MRALIVSNMQQDSAHPGRGSFVRDQVAALRRIDGIQVELVEGRPGVLGYLDLARELRGRRGYDIVHAHFGLTGYPALLAKAGHRAITLHGTDVRHPRSGRLTRAILPRYDLVAAVSQELADEIGPGTQVLPTGVALDRFAPTPQEEARAALGLEPDELLLLFPADPARAGKRADRAREVATAAGARLVTLGHTPPDQMPVWMNAADAVLVPSDAEGFGLVTVEALATGTPVLATPVGIHPAALDGLPNTLCAPYDLGAWAAAARHVRGQRVEGGRERASGWSSDAMAARVVEAWQGICASTAHRDRSRV
jgi:glycosyltransferase involved in cell wall biosynthesis